jgi:hypothetical protein
VAHQVLQVLQDLVVHQELQVLQDLVVHQVHQVAQVARVQVGTSGSSGSSGSSGTSGSSGSSGSSGTSGSSGSSGTSGSSGSSGTSGSSGSSGSSGTSGSSGSSGSSGTSGSSGSSGSSGTSGSSGSSGTSGSSGSSGSSGTSGSSGSSGTSGTSGLINLTTPDTNRLITVDNSAGTSGTAQPNLTFDASTDVLTIGEYLETTSDRIEVGDGDSGEIQQAISGTTYGGIIVDYIAYSTSREKQRTGTVRVTANSTGAVLAESSTTDIGNTDGIVFSVTASAGNFSLSVANNTGETIRVVFHNTRLKV